MDDQEPIDDELSPEELAEAEALRRALDRGAGDPALPDDALEAAALLRYSAGDDELGEGRMDAILGDVFAEAKVPAQPDEEEAKTAPWLGWLKWLFPVGGLAAAAAVAMLAVMSAEPAPMDGTAATRLPAPTAALLRAQAQAAGPGEEGQLALASAMGSYRGAVLGSLQERYEGHGR
ncbi:MAG: hypothetical protein DRJ42_10640 [Deltaproteobacteria bacterium]|nr:MAG: hypothetical protein DRJ42_10640 [Deltaproteobacteria bacterium]